MRDSKIIDQYTWEGDGTPVEGAEFWYPTASMNIEEGLRIVYYTEDGESLQCAESYPAVESYV